MRTILRAVFIFYRESLKGFFWKTISQTFFYTLQNSGQYKFLNLKIYGKLESHKGGTNLQTNRIKNTQTNSLSNEYAFQ